MIFELRPEHRGGFFMMINRVREKMTGGVCGKISGVDDSQAFEAKLRDHLFMQGQQFGEHVIRVQAGTESGGS